MAESFELVTPSFIIQCGIWVSSRHKHHHCASSGMLLEEKFFSKCRWCRFSIFLLHIRVPREYQVPRTTYYINAFEEYCMGQKYLVNVLLATTSRLYG
jgi:hypothetical protein